MSYDVTFSPVFERAVKRLAKKYPSIAGDLATLIETLSEEPRTGTALGKDCYKVRMAIRSKGKGRSSAWVLKSLNRSHAAARLFAEWQAS